MLPSLLLLLLFAAPHPGKEPAAKTADAGDGPTYTESGELRLPEKYREWIFLTSGIDMSYSSTADPAHSVFDNVFVNPNAYRSFLSTGTWPDKTVMVLETRAAEGAASINKRGHTQSPGITGLEVHVKDNSKGGWAFYGFSNPVSAAPFPRTAPCYTCHQQHGIVDTTFVQFYPTLLGIAKEKKTISPEMLKELALPAPAEAK
ncbi:MAG TPA: cytochrome P460 family protein [Edaphobacter sp.]